MPPHCTLKTDCKYTGGALALQRLDKSLCPVALLAHTSRTLRHRQRPHVLTGGLKLIVVGCSCADMLPSCWQWLPCLQATESRLGVQAP